MTLDHESDTVSQTWEISLDLNLVSIVALLLFLAGRYVFSAIAERWANNGNAASSFFLSI